ncbi:MAG: leucine-rich repeat protein [Methanomassiliicoccaceae archaeon]|nr:leucine-rich repeat protein [Methanomassiliicoccaceae archaeon]
MVVSESDSAEGAGAGTPFSEGGLEYMIKANGTVEITGLDDSSITELTIPSSVTYDSATYDVTSIGNSAFYGCTGLTSVTIPEGVMSIGNYAFYNCTGLTLVTIPSSVTSIGGYAFSDCTGLTSLTVPIDIKFTVSAFSGCIRVTSVVLTEGQTGKGASYTEYDYGKTPWYESRSKTISVTISEGVTSIGGSAFYGCTGLTSVTIPASVTSIGGSAFYGCTGLTSVTIPASVTSIGNYAFSGCTILTAFVVSADNANYSNDGQGILYNKDKTSLIQCPGGYKGGVVIPDSVTSIGNYAFYNCTGLTSVTIPEGVTSIGDSAFRYCTRLTSVTIPEGVTSIGHYAFSFCTGLTSVTIPSSVTSIGDSAFSQCIGLTSVTIPSSVTSIGDSAFSQCTGLTSVTIPSSVTSIGDYAFSQCIGLTSVTIPSSVKSIGWYAFDKCINLTSIVFLGSAPTVSIQWANTNNASTTAYHYQDATGFGTKLGGIRAVGVTVPDPPSSISSSVNAGETALSWTAPVYNGGKIDGYEVWYGTVDDSSTWSLYWTGDLLNCTVTGLDPDTTYFFGVRATNFTGASEFISTPKIISFNANGGTGSAPAAIAADYGSAVDLPSAGDLAKTGHTFGGWSHHAGGATLLTPYTVTANNETLFAVWIPDTYTITWSVDGSDISEDYEYGATPAFNGSTDKMATAQYTYVFAGWSPEIMAVTGDQTYTAEYTSTVNEYTITWVIDGTSSSASVPYGTVPEYSGTPTKVATAQYTYTFANWDVEPVAVTGDVTYTAVFDEVLRNYTVTYNINKGMGTAPSSASLGYGAALTLPAGDGMTRAGYTFGGWSLTSSGTPITQHTVTGNVTLYAAWNIITYSEVPPTEELDDIIQQNDEPVLQIGGNVTGTTLDNTLFEGLGDKTLTIDVVDDEGQVQYSWSFAGDYKEGAGTFKADISKAVPDAELENAIGSTKVQNPLVLNFAASGELPINASVTYYVGDDYADGTVLTLFFYNEETKQLEDQGQDVTVTDGKVTFDLTHCSSYVLAEPSPEEDDNTMLYIGIAAAAIAIIAVAAIVIRRH